MTRRTSHTYPLRIDSVTLPGDGRIGMTFCPGKKDPNAAFGHWGRDLVTNLAAIRGSGAGLLVSLIEAHEFDLLEVPDIGARARALRFSRLHLPITDVSIPASDFEAVWPEHGADMLERLRKGGRLR